MHHGSLCKKSTSIIESSQINRQINSKNVFSFNNNDNRFQDENYYNGLESQFNHCDASQESVNTASNFESSQIPFRSLVEANILKYGMILRFEILIGPALKSMYPIEINKRIILN